MKPKLLIVEDDEEIRSQMKWGLINDYDVLLAGDRATAAASFREATPPVVLLDLGLPPNPADTTEGFATLGELLATEPRAKVIIVSGQSERQNAMKAVAEGAYDFLPKPIQMEEMRIVLKRAFHLSQLERDLEQVRAQAPEETFEGLLGTSPAMLEVFHTIRKVATTDASVLILGESGTGKEMAAQAIHRRSRRAQGPFVAINCGAIPEALMESELFGHEKGSFTGAHAQRIGRVESASGGTLFLDEIGELPTALQVKLLRFLQEQQVERVGGHGPVPVDVRVIAATHVDLRQALAANRFREDLYYRLAVVVLKLPALRERGGDLALLAQAFLRKFAAKENRSLPGFDNAALRSLERHAWPGNVRELENRVKRAVIMSEGSRITARDLELSSEAPAGSLSLKDAREALERELITDALRRSGGKVAGAATELGISRPTLYELMDKLDIKRNGSDPR